MKKTGKTLWVVLLCVCCLLVAGLTACSEKKVDPAPTEPHVCGSVCEICGKCTSDCTDPVCADKCAGHEDVPRQ